MSIKDNIQRVVTAIGLFFTGIMAAYITWDMFGTIVGLIDSGILKGILWAGYLGLLITWIIIAPAYNALGMEN